MRSLFYGRDAPCDARALTVSLMILGMICCLAGCSVDTSTSPSGTAGQDKNASAPAAPAVKPPPSPAVSAHLQLAERCLSESRFADAERELCAILRQEPEHFEANSRLATLLNTEGRRWEATDPMFQLLKHGRFTIQDLLILASLQDVFEDVPVITAALARFPDDPLPGTGLVRSLRRDNKEREALDLLRTITAKYPEQLEAQTLLGDLLLDLGLENDFIQWEAALPTGADAHPEVWMARAAWAERHEQLPSAARSYWEAVRRAPNHRMANYNLGLVLKRLDRPELADPFLRRSETIAELESTAFPMFRSGPSVEAMKRTSQLTEELGRLWEAWGWQIAILSLQPADRDALATRDRLRRRLDHDQLPLVARGANPAEQMDLSDYPLPQFPASIADAAASSTGLILPVNFVDQADEAGIHFRYFDSWVDAGHELMLLETTGGGVAILDYDSDGWPDVYLTQCCRWPVDLTDLTHLDRLYRNLGDGTFVDVTEACGIRENGYSQGVAAGDIDNDGYADLYIGNVGQNRLYHNNGDGTFSLVAHHEDTRIIWTTSVMIADVNGDALPDIYDVNYVGGDDVYTDHCVIDGHVRACGPSKFAGEPDSLYLNAGDGTWRDVSEPAGIRTRVGRGMSVLAADLDASGDLELYVTNDVTDNFLWIQQSQSAGAIPQFVDHGVLSGLACDGSGRPQASMGIACDDVNGDGLLDLLVSNYYNDFNTLYLQEPGRIFVDNSREYGLRESTFLLLAFGCQFLDANLDGFPDAVVANGHVDDLRFRGEPWHMRPQYFHNVGGTSFVELKGKDAGRFFDKQYLGRGLAVVDWNRDGREDLILSNIADLASLPTNLTDPVGHWLAIRLRGVHSARDPLGARVAIEFAGRRRVRQLVGGSGYEASNQQQLVFGLGQAECVDRLTVFWPSGLTQEFTDVLTDTELILIEGRSQLDHVPIDR